MSRGRARPLQQGGQTLSRLMGAQVWKAIISDHCHRMLSRQSISPGTGDPVRVVQQLLRWLDTTGGADTGRSPLRYKDNVGVLTL